ncbi:MAG: glutathione synthase [Candidatus Binatia bacterium]|nr:glutathione synthase [Candidatus Binatia bacterium]
MSSPKLRIGFVMDPLDGIDTERDTTFVFLEEAGARNHECLYIRPESLSIRNGTPEAKVREVSVRRKVGDHFTLGEERPAALEELDVVLLRKDPPFDMEFFFDTHVASMADSGKVLVLNDPRGLRDANEKLYALHFPDVIPENLVSADMELLKEFLVDLGGEMIVKPLDGCGGTGIFHVKSGDRNVNAILEASTDTGRTRVMAQRYLPEVRQGDKRIILIDGEPLGGVLRVPGEAETRSNFHVGGSAAKSPLTERDREICAAVAPKLKEDGLVFVGLDVIGDYLTEVNVTSPTGVQEINALDGVKLEANMLDWIERHAPGR